MLQWAKQTEYVRHAGLIPMAAPALQAPTAPTTSADNSTVSSSTSLPQYFANGLSCVPVTCSGDTDAQWAHVGVGGWSGVGSTLESLGCQYTSVSNDSWCEQMCSSRTNCKGYVRRRQSHPHDANPPPSLSPGACCLLTVPDNDPDAPAPWQSPPVLHK